jgi:hypothetical protein
VETESALSRREATLRSAATISLAGIAFLQALELPSLFAQGRQLAILSLVAMGSCIVLGWLLAATSSGVSRQLWHAVAGASGLVLVGWAVSHLASVPGLDSDRGDWASMPGLVTGVLSALSLGVAIAAAPPTRAAVRGLATATAVSLALAPAVAVAVVGLGPGTAGGETVLASGGHIHSHGSPESAIVFQPLAGGKGGRYVYKATAKPHNTPVGVGLMMAATFVFVYGAVAYLRRRSTPSSDSVGLSGLDLDGGLA